jgi:hypothetical protein
VIASARSDEGIADYDPAARLSDTTTAELAFGFQASVVDVLATKAIRAAGAVGARSIVLGGGVAANRVLRERIEDEAAVRGLSVVIPRPGLCTDNGAMIGGSRAPIRGRRAARTDAPVPAARQMTVGGRAGDLRLSGGRARARQPEPGFLSDVEIRKLSCARRTVAGRGVLESAPGLGF